MYKGRTPSNWIVSEPGWSAARHELVSILRAARRRYWLIVLSSILAAAAIGAWRMSAPRYYESRVVIDVREAVFDEATAPPTAHELTAELHTVALSDSALFAMMDAMQLETSLRRKAPDLALSRVRERIYLEVTHDYFSNILGIPRSAKITLGFSNEDPEHALRVVRHLASLVVDRQSEQRLDQVERSVHLATQTQADILLALQAAEQRLLQARRSLLTASSTEEPRLHGELAQASATVRQLGDQLERTSSRQRSIALRNSFEREVQGLRYEVVDPGRIAPPKLFSKRTEAALSALLACALLFPMFAVAFGAFNLRVHDPDGLQRLGIPCLAEVASFPGYDLDSQRARGLARRKADHCPT